MQPCHATVRWCDIALSRTALIPRAHTACHAAWDVEPLSQRARSQGSRADGEFLRGEREEHKYQTDRHRQGAVQGKRPQGTALTLGAAFFKTSPLSRPRHMEFGVKVLWKNIVQPTHTLRAQLPWHRRWRKEDPPHAPSCLKQGCRPPPGPCLHHLTCSRQIRIACR